MSPEVSYADATVVMRHVPTAISLIDRAGLKAGEWCIVMGAAGALGSFLVQLAKMARATVIGAAGTDQRVEAARSLGADYGVNYRASDLDKEVARITGGRGVDVVFENIGDPSLWPGAFNSLARDGRLVTVGAHGGDGVHLDVRRLYTQRLSLLGFGRPIEPSDYVRSMELAAAGKLKVLVDRVLPLRDARAAHELVEHNEPLGKVILDPTLA